MWLGRLHFIPAQRLDFRAVAKRSVKKQRDRSGKGQQRGAAHSGRRSSWLERVRTQLAGLGTLFLIPVAVLVVGTFAGGYLLFKTTAGDHASASPTLRSDLPRVIRGTGTETTAGQGSYGDEPFTARSAVVVEIANGTVWIELFEIQATCASRNRIGPLGHFVLVTTPVSRATLSELPVGSPLRVYQTFWVSRQGSRSDIDGVGGAVMLTKVDTNPGGYWRGRIVLPNSKSSRGRREHLQGSFAAEWCGRVPAGVHDEVILQSLNKLGF